MQLKRSTLLESGWTFTQIPPTGFESAQEDWQACKVPTSVHVELKRLGRIPDPFKDLNEWDVQWIGEADWAFKTTFEVTQDQLDTAQADLVFEGLDTYCDITLNGHDLGSTANMFIPHRFPAKTHLRHGPNHLSLRFKSAWNEAKSAEAEHGGPRPLWNGDSSRLYSRKAQYNWGWDWGPKLMTCGPWRPIYLETYDYRFSDVRIDTALSGPRYTSGSLSVSAEITPSPPKDAVMRVTLRSSRGEVVRTAVVELGTLKWNLDNIDAWWPIGYGSQPIYTLTLELVDTHGDVRCTSSTRIAFREVKVVQEPLLDQPGTTFLFEVNGTRVFCGGSNWIPADSFLTEISDERYKRWVELLVEGNQNMLRVWGGGVYEAEALYDACDQAGVLVWQDFMFGCGLYPSHDTFNSNVKAEAEAVVMRLRNHPSVVIFAGNNEDYQVAESHDLIDYTDSSGDFSKFPAREIYEIILPEVVERLSHVQYWRGSPYGGETSRDATIGDIHQWNVWHGTQEPWANWDKLQGRFVSEFGMQGYPDMRTIKGWTDDHKQLFPQSRISANHNKADGFERRLELYLVENFRHSFEMKDYAYYTQIMQSECLSAAYRLWRREWKGKGREYVAGALVWQLNDCWPCVSWSIADYFLRPKPSYYTIKRELAKYSVGMTRKEIVDKDNERTDNFIKIRDHIELWGCNSTLAEMPVTIEVVSFDLDQGELERKVLDATLKPNQSTEIWNGQVPGQPIRTLHSQIPRPIVVQARLVARDGTILARYCSWPEPYKFLTFPDPKLSIQVDGDSVTLSCDKPVKGIVLDTKDEGGEEVRWSDQAIDLMPGDTQQVIGLCLNGRAVQARYVGQL